MGKVISKVAINFRVEPELHTTLVQESARQGMTLTAYITRLIGKGLDAKNAKK